MTVLEVLATGPQSLVEDAGRPGLASSGVGRSGAADRRSHMLANRLVGNHEDTAAVEVLLGGFAFRVDPDADRDVFVAVTGADAEVTVETGATRITVGRNARIRVSPGSTVRLGNSTAGLRSYVAVRGGVDVPHVLGSRSTDTLAGLGPDALAPGDRLAVGHSRLPLPRTDFAPVPAVGGPTATLRVVRGPRDDWLTDPHALVTTTWTVSERTSRVGARLTAASGPGVAMARRGRQLPSEGAGIGAIQVPPGGEPVVFLADHPVTGGYPVAGVLVHDDIPRAAQLRPGTTVHLEWVREGTVQ
ncbi:biotin-dependent carboxyltransferase family protein [Rhodococcus sp. HNM0569]|uniref:5-oxoprolinase subunit C family protein n=1 Tax=Rhodococcus sp. HNM0569 TaxID=2716340 RepID=UPI00146CD669|nr:biotin-dependent carboxyltransferase family protein [Rhodococcus sp. HNM0569]NLU83211.1 biotin-dependent carboxyltransferase family protein [Rhodococcus sp. HNM0569]